MDAVVQQINVKPKTGSERGLPKLPVDSASVTGSGVEGDYNVYRHEEGTAPVKINSELVKPPTYRDTAVQPGHRYFYSVDAVDVRGNQSARSEEASEVVPE